MGKMSDEQYLETQQQLVMLWSVVKDLDLGEFLSRISLAEAVGPIVDPTLYKRGMYKMEVIKGLALAFAKTQEVARRKGLYEAAALKLVGR